MTSWADARRSEATDSVRDDFNSGKMRGYDGPKPADANTALSGSNHLLFELTMNATAFGAASSGQSIANAVTGANASGTGTLSFVRFVKSDGTTVICDGTVSVTGGGGNVQLASLAIVSGAPVSVAGGTLTLPQGP